MQTLHPEEPTPLYYQLEMALRHAIETGLYPDGRLPTERGLVEQYQVSRLTVRSALRRLEDDGLIERHRARGTFVRPDALAKLVRDPGQWTFEEYIRRHTGSRTNTVLASEQIEGPTGVAARLGLAPHEPVWRILQAGLTDDEPLFLEAALFSPGYRRQTRGPGANRRVRQRDPGSSAGRPHRFLTHADHAAVAIRARPRDLKVRRATRCSSARSHTTTPRDGRCNCCSRRIAAGSVCHRHDVARGRPCQAG